MAGAILFTSLSPSPPNMASRQPQPQPPRPPAPTPLPTPLPTPRRLGCPAGAILRDRPGPAKWAPPNRQPALKPRVMPLIDGHVVASTLQNAMPVIASASNGHIKRPRLSRDPGAVKSMIAAADRGLTGRKGRQFAVANVGHNGRIYLQPTVRLAHNRYPTSKPAALFINPDVSATVDTLESSGLSSPAAAKNSGTSTAAHGSLGFNLFDQSWLSTPPTPPLVNSAGRLNGLAVEHVSTAAAARLPTYRPRPRSDSTIHDLDPGALKIVIYRPAAMDVDVRDRELKNTMDTAALSVPPTLDIPIPCWRIGSPRFSHLGTPFFRASAYAPSDEFRVSELSLANIELAFAHHRLLRLNSIPTPFLAPLQSISRTPAVRTPAPETPGPYRLTTPTCRLVSSLPGSTDRPDALPASPPAVSPDKEHAGSEPPIKTESIEPAMFDPLTLRPACDDRSVVRYCLSTGAVIAATAPRLVAEITSPSFLDYDLLSDFFLTYRSYLAPNSLLRLLAARWRWTLSRDDDVGTICRVRTFVALRHWILNYFVDDFAPDLELRLAFCRQINQLVHESLPVPTPALLHTSAATAGTPLKILAELMKCWRRTCARVWEQPSFAIGCDALAPIHPGFGLDDLSSPTSALLSVPGRGHDRGRDRGPGRGPNRGSQPGPLSPTADLGRGCGPARIESHLLSSSPTPAPRPTVDQSSFYDDVPRAGQYVQGIRPSSAVPRPSRSHSQGRPSSSYARPAPAPTPASAPRDQKTGLDIHGRTHPNSQSDPGLDQDENSPRSRRSINSLEVVSCSFPSKISYAHISPHAKANNNTNGRGGHPDHHPLTAHPVSFAASFAASATSRSISIYRSSGPVAATPKSLVGKRVRPTHRRTTSLNDSLREHSPDRVKRLGHSHSQNQRTGHPRSLRRGHGTGPAESGPQLDALSTTLLPYPGSLVRGVLLPPGQALVDVVSIGAALKESQRQTTIVIRPPGTVAHQGRRGVYKNGPGPAAAASGLGMRRLVDNVRRAFGSKTHFIVPMRGNSFNMALFGPATGTTKSLPEIPGLAYSHPAFGQTGLPLVRFDLLSASAVEDFKRAVKEEQVAMAAAASITIVAAAATAAATAATATVPRTSTPLSAPTPLLVSAVAVDTESSCPPTSSSTSQLDSTPRLLTNRNHPVLDYSAAYMESSMDTSVEQSSNHDPRPWNKIRATMGTQSELIVGRSRSVDRPSPHVVTLSGVNESAESVGCTKSSDVEAGNQRPAVPVVPIKARTMGNSQRRSERLNPPPSHSGNRTSSMRPVSSADITNRGTYPRLSECLSATSRHGHPSFSRTRSPTTGSSAYEERSQPTHNRSSLTQQSVGSSWLRRRESYQCEDIAVAFAIPDSNVHTACLDLGSDATSVPLQPRLLRRRPGGDLRAAQNVGDLDVGVRREHAASVGSLPGCTDSMCANSLLNEVLDGSTHHGESGGVQVGVVVNTRRRQTGDGAVGSFATAAEVQNGQGCKLSLFSTHSSQPIMRPSFAVEAKKLAQIPDADDDDGGVESALLKLEGRYDRRPSAESESFPQLGYEESGLSVNKEGKGREGVEQGDKCDYNDHNDHNDLGDRGDERSHGGTDSDSEVSNRHEREQRIQKLRDNVDNRPASSTNKPAPAPAAEVVPFHDDLDSCAVTTTAKDGRAVWQDAIVQHDRGEQQPPVWDEDYCEDLGGSNGDGNGEGDAMSDLSSELSSVDTNPSDIGLWNETRIGVVNEYRDTKQPTTVEPPSHEPPTAAAQPDQELSRPITLGQALQMSPTGVVPVTKLYEQQQQRRQQWQHKPLPPTPGTSSAIGQETAVGDWRWDRMGRIKALQRQEPVMRRDEEAGRGLERSREHSVHLPFILGVDSEVLAQQFTMIEKDALQEIDWRELVEMSWREPTATQDVRSWVDFLRRTDGARGVEVVVARFNLMVKWAVSEVVLTRDLEERARCVVKLIHVAAHCRRYRNFATMAQLAIALGSREVSGLSRTWAMVPTVDSGTLAELDRLISPTRNFYALRAEMETEPCDGSGSHSRSANPGPAAAPGVRPTAGLVAGGCVPLLSIYTQDLLFNAQRPARVAGGALVNFERCRCTASVVKTALRLLEASDRYSFALVEGVTERCLWMRALADEDLRRHAASLE